MGIQDNDEGSTDFSLESLGDNAAKCAKRERNRMLTIQPHFKRSPETHIFKIDSQVSQDNKISEYVEKAQHNLIKSRRADAAFSVE